jgi:hypothetical protein
MADFTGVASGIAESSWMPSGMADAIGILEAVQMNESIVTTGAFWVVRSIGLVEASGMLLGISIPPTKNNLNIGETLLLGKSFYHQIVSHFSCNIPVKK